MSNDNKNNQFSSPRVAIVSYFTTNKKTYIFVITKDLDEPFISEAKFQDGKPVTSNHLRLCAQRLIVDFNGLPQNWKEMESADLVAECLKLTPEIRQTKLRINLPPFYPNTYLQGPLYKFQLTYIEDLSEALVPVDVKDLIKDCDLLCFSPHGPLHTLPLHALTWEKGEYLIEKFGVCYTPSVSVLKYCQAKNPVRKFGLNHKPENCLAIAVGAKENSPQDFEADVDFFSSKFKKDRLTSLNGHAATKEQVKKNLSNKSITHFGCHGIFLAEGDPLDSGLLLSDGRSDISIASVNNMSYQERTNFFLTAREIFDLRLDNTDLVALRACSSGRSMVTPGDELIGLSRAFLYAGTPSLIVTLWNVYIQSSYKLLKEFYRLWLDQSNPLPKWKALQLAQIALLKDIDTERFHHPYHWAPIILIGDWL